MAFLVSPGVQIIEKDLTNIIPAVSTSIGGFAGVFQWGPGLEATLVSSEANLIDNFGYPITSSVEASSSRADWYAAANFLAYSNALQVVRVLPDGARNAANEASGAEARKFGLTVLAPPAGNVGDIVLHGTTTIGDIDSTYNTIPIVTTSTNGVFDCVTTIASALGLMGIAHTKSDNTIVYEVDAAWTMPAATADLSYQEFAAQSALSTALVSNYNDFLVEQHSLADGTMYARYPGKLGNGVGVALIDANCTDSTTVLFGSTTVGDLFDDVPGTSVWAQNNYSVTGDEVHVVVYTTNTDVTGSANEVLETYAFLSKAKNAKTADGGPNYYADIVNGASKWVYLLPETSVVAGTAGATIGANITTDMTGTMDAIVATGTKTGVRQFSLVGGSDGTIVSDGNYTEAWDVLNDADTVDVNLLITGTAHSSVNVQKYVVQIAERRKDAMAFVSPSYAASVTNPTAAKIIEFFNGATAFNSSSYVVFDSGWKRQYDRYNDEYFWTPLNADVAGLVARAEYTNDAWWSPAGLNRGFIKNVVKLSYNPSQTDRDALYPKRINPVVTLRGQGTLLYGDKTGLSRPSAFDRINVRRLFIILEKAIATSAKYQLFEFNDDITRRAFVNAVEPFLSDIKSRRGITDFKVVCDTSNNTGEVIDGNRFVADIYIKPARSINFITLNFVAVRTGVSFSEVAGA